MFSILSNALDWLKGMLPRSPIREYLTETTINQDWLHYLNWFVPVGTIISILEVWLTCIAAYFLISAILRYFKVIS